MIADYPRKSAPKKIAIFGAGGRMARHVVDYLRYKAPEIHLRLLASSAESQQVLRQMYSDGDIRIGNYLQRETLTPALDGCDAAFVVTASGMDEEVGMNNFVDAVRAAGTLEHIIRLVGFAPESSPDDIPQRLLELGGDSDQHFTARRILREAKLPVTYVNLGASLMDNFMFTIGGIQRNRTLIRPTRQVPVMDGRDLGEVIARIFLSDDARHIGSFHTVNNGYDYPTTSEVAELMSDVFMTTIKSDQTYEAFEAEYGDMIRARWGREEELEYRYGQFKHEYENILWTLNSFAEQILQRRPNTFRSWLQEHRQVFLPSD